MFFEDLLEGEAEGEGVDEAGRSEETRHRRVDVGSGLTRPQAGRNRIVQHLR